MENKNKQETERFVDEHMALLAAPDDWQPDASVARTRFEGRLAARRRPPARIWLQRAAVAVVVCLVLLLAIPKTRVLAVQLWQWLTVRNVEVVQADFRKVQGVWLVPQMRFEEAEAPPDGEIQERGGHGIGDLLGLNRALDLPAAARQAGFIPRLPLEGVPAVEPNLMILNPVVWSSTVKVADLESSLRQAGVVDQPIPAEWDGAEVSIHIGSAIFTDWQGEVALLQHPPITLSAPAGFDFTAYWMAALRASGVDRDRARQLAERLKMAPTLLLGIGAGANLARREVSLRTGQATLLEHKMRHGERFTLIWSVADRFYHLDAPSEEQAIRAANSIVAGPEENATATVTESEAGGELPKGSYRVLIRSEKLVLFTLTPDGRIVITEDGQVMVEGLYQIQGREIVMKDMKEKHGKTEKGCAGEGKYKWSFDGKALGLTKIADDCQGRAEALTGSTMLLVEGKN